MKKLSLLVVLVLGLVLLLGAVAAPALAYDDSNNRGVGYWKMHPDAWPVDTIVVGDIVYTKAQAIAMMGKNGSDKSVSMFCEVVAAKLNRLAYGGDRWFIESGNWWIYMHPIGTGMKSNSPAWIVDGAPIYGWLDAWNNGVYEVLYPY